ncbi:hypothetical protein F4781DRAFT_434134 [Annulohypoxylon bovei var. microspora]|nr:hypothetical protein F4781DRAFT_434134 [Annulohypoxylon bovei var. microspora]
MAIIEIVFPQLKKDPESLKEALTKLSVALATFKEGGVQRGLQGFIDSENGVDVSADAREVLILEWPSEATFHAFIKSPGFGNFMAQLKPFVNGPPELNLFETNAASYLFGARPFLEILLIRPKNTSNDEDVETILKKVQSSLEKVNDSDSVYGSSLNLPKKIATVIRVFTSKAERDAAKLSPQEISNEVGSLADITRLVAEVKVLPL